MKAKQREEMNWRWKMAMNIILQKTFFFLKWHQSYLFILLQPFRLLAIKKFLNFSLYVVEVDGSTPGPNKKISQLEAVRMPLPTLTWRCGDDSDEWNGEKFLVLILIIQIILKNVFYILAHFVLAFKAKLRFIKFFFKLISLSLEFQKIKM